MELYFKCSPIFVSCRLSMFCLFYCEFLKVNPNGPKKRNNCKMYESSVPENISLPDGVSEKEKRINSKRIKREKKIGKISGNTILAKILPGSKILFKEFNSLKNMILLLEEQIFFNTEYSDSIHSIYVFYLYQLDPNCYYMNSYYLLRISILL